MAVVYWIGQAPNATVTLAQAIALANLMTTGGNLSATGTITGAGAITGSKIDVAQIALTSAVADLGTAVIDITLTPTSKILGTTARSTATVGAALTDTGILKVTCKTSTGGSIVRYIKLWST